MSGKETNQPQSKLVERNMRIKDDGTSREFEMRLTTVNGSTRARSVFKDSDGDEFVIVSGERHYLDLKIDADNS